MGGGVGSNSNAYSMTMKKIIILFYCPCLIDIGGRGWFQIQMFII
jgi:hypothetical protein